jgi:nucleoid-associated protein YgaU
MYPPANGMALPTWIAFWPISTVAFETSSFSFASKGEKTMSIESYIVKRGDTLSQIAAAHGTTVEKFLAANPEITNPDRIYEGQVLILPATGGSGYGDDEGRMYTVKQGDRLYQIARDNYGAHLPDSSIAELVKLIATHNNLPNPDKIKVGQVLKLPAVSI